MFGCLSAGLGLGAVRNLICHTRHNVLDSWRGSIGPAEHPPPLILKKDGTTCTYLDRV